MFNFHRRLKFKHLEFLMIPKIIHYCWFGPNKIPEQLIQYMQSWRLFCPDYEIKLWNEDSFDINSHSFTQSAYKEKKYAYVSDYVRAYALDNYGGVYLDTDVELKHNLDIFLNNEAFTGFECIGAPFTAVWGSTKNHSLTKRVLEYYNNKKFSKDEPTNTASVSEILINYYGINPLLNSKQEGKDNINCISIYPSTTFCLDLKLNYATHHFSGSWIENKKKSFKVNVHEKYLIESMTENKTIYSEKDFLKNIAQNLTYKNLLLLLRYFIKYKIWRSSK